MRSSTSSSDWGKTWLLAFVLTAASLAGWECYLRSEGHRPTIVDSPCLWSYWRSQAVGDRVVVVLGDSQPQLGWCNSACEQMLPGYRSIQLAIDGRPSAVAVLRDLALDEQFRGVVVVGTTERGLDRAYWGDQAGYVDYYRRAYHANSWANTSVSCWLHQRLSILDPRLKLDQIVTHVAKHRAMIPPFYVTGCFNRSRLADFTRVDASKIRNANPWRGETVRPCAGQWLAGAMEIEQYVRMIHARGGRVAYVRFPCSDRMLEINEASYPRSEFWGRLAGQTEATVIHSRDYPELARIHCPDMAHVDYRDTPQLTRAIVRILRDKHVFRFEDTKHVRPDRQVLEIE